MGTRFNHGYAECNDEELIQKIPLASKILLQGTAGGGKSIFLRFINMVIASSSASIIPLFYELKSLNISPAPTLKSALIETLSHTIKDITESSFSKLLETGRIILILDGFDEIDHENRVRYAKEIRDMGKFYPDCCLIVSSRPDDVISTIDIFSVYRVLPFSKRQTVELLRKLPYDEAVKEKFIQSVNGGLYEKHQGFLSNPLLITMMLMTYHQFAEIPSKIHIFYQQAFETLFSWHDSSKGVFKRKSYSGLAIDEFQRVFSYFCAKTYSEQKFLFSAAYIRERLKESASAEGVEVDAEDILKDLLISTCLLQMDGLDIVFVHRSFQEYFTALFISRMDSKSCNIAIESIIKRSLYDLVLQMTHEINPSLVDSAWSLPTIKSMTKITGSVDPRVDPINYFKAFFSDISLVGGEIYLHYDLSNIWAYRLGGISKLYPRPYSVFEKGEVLKGNKDLRRELRKNKVLFEKFSNATPHLRSKLRLNMENSILFSLNNIPSEILDYFPLYKWSIVQDAWLLNLRKELSVKVKERKSSLSAIFGD